MIDILQYALAFVVAIGVLITFHEFGHFWVARRCDVKIQRFSVGFGRPLWRRYFGPDRTEFVIAALPLGGYVKMLDEREGDVPATERHRAFNNKSLGQRTAIVLAGPLFNFLFAIAAYWCMYMVGMTGLKPMIDTVEPGSVAAEAGLTSGDEIISVNDRRTPTWATVAEIMISRVVDGGRMAIMVEDASGRDSERYLDLSRLSIDDIAEGSLLERLGITPMRPQLPALIAEVVADGAADRAGIRAGDKILMADQRDIRDWHEFVDVIREYPGEPVALEIERGGDRLVTTVIPEAHESGTGEIVGRIGVMIDADMALPSDYIGVERYAPHTALWRGVVRTGEMSVLTLRVLAKIVLGEASIKNLSGPISIAQYAGYSAAVGLAAFLGFMAIVSVSLGVINLLPIPILDGGHLMYYLIEFVKGSPVSEPVQVFGQQIGLALLLVLMAVVIYNDIVRIFG
jgi:regulator of sigma E protease